MKNYIHFIVFLISSTFFSQINAQEVTGKVIDKDGLPIPSVNVVNQNSKSSTVTDLDGSFSIKSKVGDKLKFSMVGFETITISSSTSPLNITLIEVTKALDEVVVVGYGTKKKGAITGSVSQIKSADILKNPGQSAIQSIQGKAAGVNIVTNDEPGANPTIVIRGLGTILGARSPLYVIDGVESGSLNGLSANDIASFDILKDASSLAIY
ncbi:carboxypeptidase-like regulatory domain-containing protein [Flavobacterium myungsuense]